MSLSFPVLSSQCPFPERGVVHDIDCALAILFPNTRTGFATTAAMTGIGIGIACRGTSARFSIGRGRADPDSLPDGLDSMVSFVFATLAAAVTTAAVAPAPSCCCCCCGTDVSLDMEHGHFAFCHFSVR